MRRRLGACAAMLAGLWVATSTASWAEIYPDEVAPEITAAFILNFARYTEWSPSRFEGTDHPFVFSVVGDQVVAAVLSELVEGETLYDRPVSVRHLEPPRPGDYARFRESLRESHIVFVGSTHRDHAREVLRSLEDVDALTIGCFAGFVQNGGMLSLRIEGDRMRFTANLEAIKRGRLKVSSKVLRLAESVDGGFE